MNRIIPAILYVIIATVWVSAQNVGISDVLFTPQSSLHVYRNSDSNILQLSKSSTANTGLIFSVSGNNWTMRNWHDSELQLRTGNGNMTFYTNSSERMLIQPDGKVGKGISVPNHALTINGQMSNDVLRLIGADGGVGFGAYLRFGDGDNVYLREDVDDALLIYSSSRKALMGGNVGIGDNSPAAMLTVGNGDLFMVESSGHVRTLSANSAAPSYSFTSDVTSGMFLPASNHLAFSTGGSERVRIANNGYCGIGTTTPLQALQVQGNVRFSGALMPGAKWKQRTNASFPWKQYSTGLANKFH